MVRLMRRPSVCPNCGEPVSTFAAGCAVCGADLEAHRAALAARRSPLARAAAWRPHVPDLRLEGPDIAMLVVTLLLALFAPLFGLLLAALCAFAKHRDGQLTMRNVLIGLGALALVRMLFPFAVLWGL